MRNARRSNQQLTRTSANRARVFEFMERFSARHLYTIDGPPDTDLDEIMAFAYEGGVAVVHTFEGGSPLWTLYTEPSVSGELERAMRLQIDERQAGADAPLSSMWVMKMLEGMIPRMSDEALKQASDLFDQALRDGIEAQIEFRIPVEGMTPNGFPEPVPDPTSFGRDTHDLVPDVDPGPAVGDLNAD